MKKKIKSTLLIVMTLVLVSAAAVAITWAAVTTKMSPKENTFTTKNIALSIAEPAWDGLEHGEDRETDPKVDPNLGINMAKSYSPSANIPKDPSLKNVSESGDEWVAMKVSYKLMKNGNVYSSKGTEGSNDATSVDSFSDEVATYKSYNDFSNAIAKVQTTGTDGFNTTNWKEASGSNGTLFYYNKKLAKDSTTDPLFDHVVINSSFTMTDVYASDGKKSCYEIKVGNGSTYYFETLPQFEIDLSGYAIQADADNSTIADASAAITEIKSVYGLS